MEGTIFFFLLLPFFLHASWAEERLAGMTLEEKVGALFVLPLSSKGGAEHKRTVKRLLREYHIGSVLPKEEDALAQVEMVNWAQGLSRDGLLCLIDAEWGLGMRLRNAPSFPKNLVLGTLHDDQLLYAMGSLLGRQAQRIGAHIVLGPVVDVNSNPHNRCIHGRSFGGDPDNVARKSSAFIRGLQENGILAVAKHFPGHGDVEIDSHEAMPSIEKTMQQLQERDLIPFQQAIDTGVRCIMTGHLRAPLIDPDLPCPLSPLFKELLETMGFTGLLISDALNMKGITNHYSPEEIALGYLQNGHDLLLYGAHDPEEIQDILERQIPKAYAAILEAVSTGELSLDAKVLKILQMKEEQLLQRDRTTNPNYLLEDLEEESRLFPLFSS